MVTTRWDEIRAQCQAFHEQHPRVWELFVRFAFEKINAGFQHYSVKGIFERIRWETAEADNPGGFKINNNYTAFYARRFHAMYPQHDGFFRLRTQTSEGQSATNLPELTPGYFDTRRI